MSGGTSDSIVAAHAGTRPGSASVSAGRSNLLGIRVPPGYATSALTIWFINAFSCRHRRLERSQLHLFSQDATAHRRTIHAKINLVRGPHRGAQASTAERDELRVAFRNANARSGPGTGFDKIRSLGVGEEVPVTGKVEGRNWYCVALPDGGAGFVFADMLGAFVVAPPPRWEPGDVFTDSAHCPAMVVVPSSGVTKSLGTRGRSSTARQCCDSASPARECWSAIVSPVSGQSKFQVPFSYDGFQSPAAGPGSGRVSPESHDAIVTISAWS